MQDGWFLLFVGMCLVAAWFLASKHEASTDKMISDGYKLRMLKDECGMAVAIHAQRLRGEGASWSEIGEYVDTETREQGMSEKPSDILDGDFVQDFYVQDLTQNQVWFVMSFWEHHRESIELRLDSFDDLDHMSWRDYRNQAFEWLDDPLVDREPGTMADTVHGLLELRGNTEVMVMLSTLDEQPEGWTHNPPAFQALPFQAPPVVLPDQHHPLVLPTPGGLPVPSTVDVLELQRRVELLEKHLQDLDPVAYTKYVREKERRG